MRDTGIEGERERDCERKRARRREGREREGKFNYLKQIDHKMEYSERPKFSLPRDFSFESSLEPASVLICILWTTYIPIPTQKT